MPGFHSSLSLVRLFAFEDIAGTAAATMLGALALSPLDSVEARVSLVLSSKL